MLLPSFRLCLTDTNMMENGKENGKENKADMKGENSNCKMKSKYCQNAGCTYECPCNTLFF